MGIQIPGELSGLLNELGYVWPESDEERLFELAQAWIAFGAEADAAATDATAAVALLAGNDGSALEAFRGQWSDSDSAAAVLQDIGFGARAVGAALLVCALVVLALKINVIVQLTLLAISIAQAIATAAPTFGASLLEIPVFKKLVDIAIDFLIGQALEAVLG
ncbi:WXG100-like domain-containing protein [Micromonospora profundi]|uniref:WXG100-like domain-containing protein n=1 Tax=Micromonospora profundi TaxID=1420889 RepID=UPI0038202CDF